MYCPISQIVVRESGGFLFYLTLSRSQELHPVKGVARNIDSHNLWQFPVEKLGMYWENKQDRMISRTRIHSTSNGSLTWWNRSGIL